MEFVNWEDLTILVTGATGSFGHKFIEFVLKEKRPKKLIIFSRDELKQHEMRLRFPDTHDSSLRYFIGDVRDKDRLIRAFRGVDVVVHAAALKQVPACEYNPFEAVKTNIIGAQNIIDAAIDCGVRRVVALSTDKAVNPINLYGATKLVAEKLFIQGNAYVGEALTRFACVRYGNVVGSRGSIVPLLLNQRQKGSVTITDLSMTRFWITLDQGVKLVIKAIESMEGGEIFIPKIPSMCLKDLVETIAPDCTHEIMGIRAGEKMHEALISYDESRHTVEYDDIYVIRPDYFNKRMSAPIKPKDDDRTIHHFSYSSDNNKEWLTQKQLLALISNFETDTV